MDSKNINADSRSAVHWLETMGGILYDDTPDVLKKLALIHFFLENMQRIL